MTKQRRYRVSIFLSAIMVFSLFNMLVLAEDMSVTEEEDIYGKKQKPSKWKLVATKIITNAGAGG